MIIRVHVDCAFYWLCHILCVHTLRFLATCQTEFCNRAEPCIVSGSALSSTVSRSFLHYASSKCVGYRSAKTYYTSNTGTTWLLCGNANSSGCQGSLHTPTRWACKPWSCVSSGTLGNHLYHAWSFLSRILLLAYHRSAIYALHAIASFASKFLGNSNINSNTTTNTRTTRSTMFSAPNRRCIQ